MDAPQDSPGTEKPSDTNFDRSLRLLRMIFQKESLLLKEFPESNDIFFEAVAAGCIPMVEVMQRGGSSSSAHDRHSQTTLHVAIANGRKEMAVFLLDHGAPVNRYNRECQTPLDLALAKGEAEIEALLRARGGLTAGDLATQKRALMRRSLRFAAIFILLPVLALGGYAGYRLGLRRWRIDQAKTLEKAIEKGRQEEVRALVENNPEILKYTARKKNTPLHLAVWNNNLDAVRFLVEQGADTGAPNEEGHTPLHWAAKKGQLETVVLLLKSNSWILENTDNQGRTPLSFAARQGHVEVVKELLKHGAKIRADAYGQTPINYAMKNGYDEVVVILRNHRKSDSGPPGD